jgi:hypothetical protein
MLRRLSLLLFSILFFGSSIVYAQAQKDTTKKDSKSSYEKLFKDKKTEVEEGLMTLRKMDGKVYFEFPIDLLEKNMLLGTAVSSTSNPGDAAVGERPQSPLPIYFTKTDSTIYMRLARFSNKVVNGADNIREALQKNNIGPILNSFEIEAVTPDSSALVFNATDIFLSGNDKMDPFGPYSGVSLLFGAQKQNFKKGLSTLVDVDAYSNNVTVTSYLSFGITSTFLGFQVEKDRPATYQVKHTLVLLPDDLMRPRHSDPRIGVSDTEYLAFSASDNGVQSVKYAHRWDLDSQKPILFYIDDDFPDYLADDVKKGVAHWNKAFAKIGYGNVISTKPFPKNDPEFSRDNTSYNTINYILSNRESALAQTWVDPRTGEILNASINVYKGTIDKARKDLFIRTAGADKRARTAQIPDNLLEKSVQDIVTHQIGHTLGLTNNFGASSAVPVDSLRSPSYTQKYGITPSIMDEARYNFVAQPGDMEQGVQMTPNDLGVYDYYAISWLYKSIPTAETPEDEIPILEEWISEKIGDPKYRYRKQHVRGVFDPDIQANDLGNDQIKATKYALDNLRFVMNNMNQWVEGEDEDYKFRTKMNFSIINIDFFWYIIQVYQNIGGVHQYQKFEGDPYPAYEVVPEEKQQQSVAFVLETLEGLHWFDNAALENNLNSINGNASSYIRSTLFKYLLDWGLRRIEFSQQKTNGNTYTTEVFLEEVFDFVWKSPLKGKAPTEGELDMQSELVNYLIQKSPVKKKSGGSNSNGRTFNGNNLAMLQLGLEQQKSYQLQQLHQDVLSESMEITPFDRLELFGTNKLDGASAGKADKKDMLYLLLKRSQNVLSDAVNEVDGKIKRKYEYLLMKINKALEIS